MIKKMVSCIVVIIFFLVSLVGCGGGFDHDSANAKNIDKSIFGPDSISNESH